MRVSDLGPLVASPDPERPIDLLGTAIDGERWVVMLRQGALEDRTSDVLAVSSRGVRAIEPLGEALAIDALRAEPDAASMVATFELSRPHLVRVPFDAERTLVARELSPGATLPSELAHADRAWLDVDGGALVLRRADAAGDPRGLPIVVDPRASGLASLARGEDGYVIVWVDPSGGLSARPVRCD
ncbi:MAG: hypothetical protein AB7S26_07440 [Sandaracinaceae bacterium]